MRQLPALTGVRFVAAIAVVYSHAHAAFVPASQSDNFYDFLDGGRTAVSFFFVLSGFILTYNYPQLHKSNRQARMRYFTARFARIFPGVWLGLILATVGVVYALRNPSYMMSWYAINPSYVNASLIVSFFAQMTGSTGWFPVAAINQPWNSPAWSISCEIFFYLCLPSLLLVMRKVCWRNRILLVLASFGLQAIALFVIIPLFPPNRAGFLTSQFPVTHFAEFIMGVLVALVYERNSSGVLTPDATRRWIFYVSISYIAIISIIQPVTPVYFLLAPGFAGLIYALAMNSEKGILSSNFFTLLGSASYCLYITHIPMFHIVQIVWPYSTSSAGLVAVPVAIVLSLVFNRFWEEPMRKKIIMRKTNI